jgi:hypothetical protein
MAHEETNGLPQKPADENDFVVVDEFSRNRPEGEIEQYRGNWVAWSRDGRKVLFADPDPEMLVDKIDAAGLKRGEYVLSGIPKANVLFLGGMFAFEAEWGP